MLGEWGDCVVFSKSTQFPDEAGCIKYFREEKERRRYFGNDLFKRHVVVAVDDKWYGKKR